nr:DUF1810 family protein [Shimia sp. R9_3]
MEGQVSRPDIHDLARFLPQQAETHTQALAELTAGHKVTHWIWWELPQLRILGRSQRAYDYGLADLSEATPYLNHPLLGPHLIEMCNALLRHSATPIADILGSVDALKVRSTATLFASIDNADPAFTEVLTMFYGGQKCPETEAHIQRFRNNAT